MTTIQLNKTFTQLKALDVRAGKLFGNADHLRVKKIDGISYALDLGTRIFLLGLTTALLQSLLTFIWMLGNSQATFLAGLTDGFILFLICRSLYPDQDSIMLPLCLDLGCAALVGMAAGIHGVAVDITLEAAIVPLLSVSFGCLLAMQILGFLFKCIAQAFAGPPPPLRPSIKRIRRAGLLTLEEEVEFRRLRPFILPLVASVIVPLLIIPAFLINLQLGVVSIAIYFACLIASIPGGLMDWRLERAVISRLRQEGQIKPITTVKVYTITVSDNVGYTLAGVPHIGKKIYPEGYNASLDHLPMNGDDERALFELKRILKLNSRRREIVLQSRLESLPVATRANSETPSAL